jgi:hypothetical protein
MTGGNDVGAAVVESQDVDLGNVPRSSMQAIPLTVSCSVSIFHGKRSCWSRSGQESPNAIR